jgi:hypothetical protein
MLAAFSIFSNLAKALALTTQSAQPTKISRLCPAVEIVVHSRLVKVSTILPKLVDPQSCLKIFCRCNFDPKHASTRTWFYWTTTLPHLVGHASSRRRHSSIRIIYIGEWKYCAYNNLKYTHHLIIAKWTPLANALSPHWFGTKVDIIPIVMSRIGTPHTLTHRYTHVTSLINPRTDQPDNPPKPQPVTLPGSSPAYTYILSNGFPTCSASTASNPSRHL